MARFMQGLHELRGGDVPNEAEINRKKAYAEELQRQMQEKEARKRQEKEARLREEEEDRARWEAARAKPAAQQPPPQQRAQQQQQQQQQQPQQPPPRQQGPRQDYGAQDGYGQGGVGGGQLQAYSNPQRRPDGADPFDALRRRADGGGGMDPGGGGNQWAIVPQRYNNGGGGDMMSPDRRNGGGGGYFAPSDKFLHAQALQQAFHGGALIQAGGSPGGGWDPVGGSSLASPGVAGGSGIFSAPPVALQAFHERLKIEADDAARLARATAEGISRLANLRAELELERRMTEEATAVRAGPMLAQLVAQGASGGTREADFEAGMIAAGFVDGYELGLDAGPNAHLPAETALVFADGRLERLGHGPGGGGGPPGSAAGQGRAGGGNPASRAASRAAAKGPPGDPLGDAAMTGQGDSFAGGRRGSEAAVPPATMQPRSFGNDDVPIGAPGARTKNFSNDDVPVGGQGGGPKPTSYGNDDVPIGGGRSKPNKPDGAPRPKKGELLII